MPKVSRNGRITLPKRARDALGIVPGSEVELELRDGAAIVRKRLPPQVLDRWRGYLGARGETLSSDDLAAQLREP